MRQIEHAISELEKPEVHEEFEKERDKEKLHDRLIREQTKRNLAKLKAFL